MCSVDRAFFAARLRRSIAGAEDGPAFAASLPGRSLTRAEDAPAGVAGVIPRVGNKAMSENGPACAAGVGERQIRGAEDCLVLVAGSLAGYFAKSSEFRLVKDSVSESLLSNTGGYRQISFQSL